MERTGPQAEGAARLLSDCGLLISLRTEREHKGKGSQMTYVLGQTTLRIIVGLLGVASLFSAHSPAMASHDAISLPSGCISWAQGRNGNFSSPSNCYVSRAINGYDAHSHYTVAAQYLARARGTTAIPNGAFDTRTYNAIRLYQELEGLTIDGIVGQQVWDRMRVQLIIGPTTGGFTYYSTAGPEGNAFARATNGTHQWWVDPTACGFQHMDILGPC